MEMALTIKQKKGAWLLFILLPLSLTAYGQKASLKTNLLYGATTTINAAFEIGIGSNSSIEINGGWNPWEFKDNKILKHYLVQPEFRWWFCETFNGSFMGVHLLGGEYNVGGISLPMGIFKSLKDHRYEGYYYGGGINLGHQWILSKRWSIEAILGGGYIRTHFDKYPFAKCGKKLATDDKNYFGLTKAGVSLTYYLW